MSYLTDKRVEHCCGCNACVQICPVSCISMEMMDGFYYPKIKEEKCIHCNLCKSVCQYEKDNIAWKKNQSVIDVYAGWSRDEQEVSQSTSGAIFPVLAKYVIDNDGVVYGTILDDNQMALVSSAFTLEEVDAMKGSKYIRSDTKNTYKQVKEQLLKDKMVLYTGTPCQIAGLRTFLKKDYENLICVDLVCHGVPSELLMKYYKKYLEEKYGSRIIEFKFRHMAEGAMQSEYCIKFDNGFIIKEALGVNEYSKTYNSLIAHMPACMECPYTNLKRNGDITIGDFWGIGKINLDEQNEKGTSLIIVNSEKGKKLIESINDKLKLYVHEIHEAVPYNPPLSHCNKPHPWRKKFLKALEKEGFEKTHRKYIKVGNKILLGYRALRKVKTLVKGDK